MWSVVIQINCYVILEQCNFAYVNARKQTRTSRSTNNRPHFQPSFLTITLTFLTNFLPGISSSLFFNNCTTKTQHVIPHFPPDRLLCTHLGHLKAIRPRCSFSIVTMISQTL